MQSSIRVYSVGVRYTFLFRHNVTNRVSGFVRYSGALLAVSYQSEASPLAYFPRRWLPLPVAGCRLLFTPMCVEIQRILPPRTRMILYTFLPTIYFTRTVLKIIDESRGKCSPSVTNARLQKLNDFATSSLRIRVQQNSMKFKTNTATLPYHKLIYQ